MGVKTGERQRRNESAFFSLNVDRWETRDKNLNWVKILLALFSVARTFFPALWHYGLHVERIHCAHRARRVWSELFGVCEPRWIWISLGPRNYSRIKWQTRDGKREEKSGERQTGPSEVRRVGSHSSGDYDWEGDEIKSLNWKLSVVLHLPQHFRRREKTKRRTDHKTVAAAAASTADDQIKMWFGDRQTAAEDEGKY